MLTGLYFDCLENVLFLVRSGNIISVTNRQSSLASIKMYSSGYKVIAIICTVYWELKATLVFTAVPNLTKNIINPITMGTFFTPLKLTSKQSVIYITNGNIKEDCL